MNEEDIKNTLIQWLNKNYNPHLDYNYDNIWFDKADLKQIIDTNPKGFCLYLTMKYLENGTIDGYIFRIKLKFETSFKEVDYHGKKILKASKKLAIGQRIEELLKDFKNKICLLEKRAEILFGTDNHIENYIINYIKKEEECLEKEIEKSKIEFQKKKLSLNYLITNWMLQVSNSHLQNCFRDFTVFNKALEYYGEKEFLSLIINAYTTAFLTENINLEQDNVHNIFKSKLTTRFFDDIESYRQTAYGVQSFNTFLSRYKNSEISPEMQEKISNYFITFLKDLKPHNDSSSTIEAYTKSYQEFYYKLEECLGKTQEDKNRRVLEKKGTN